jgi:7,8-dihydropterin-6-yl-methyl-4-(beta-D-ribofuranosyl)aminobenzene 5'-phosphate synthase
MKRRISITISIAFIAVLLLSRIVSQSFATNWQLSSMRQSPSQTTSVGMKNLNITVLYDNNPYQMGLGVNWGFSCILKGTEKTILFDTGGNGSMLLDNMRTLGVNPLEIDLVILSHIHGDHVGGLFEFLRENPEVTVYLPKSFPEDFKDKVRDHKANVVEISGPAGVCQNVYSTGELGTYLEEQALVVDADGGLIIITGCAHPGIVNVVEKAMEMIPKDVLLVLGGFHLQGDSQYQIERIASRLKALDVEHVGPCHCSGERARALFQKVWGRSYVDVGAGRVIAARDLE